MNHITIIAGARPNFMKAAPLLRELEKSPKINSLLVHTGQHYDKNMSDVFFDDLDIQKPDYLFNTGSGLKVIKLEKLWKNLRTFVPKLIQI